MNLEQFLKSMIDVRASDIFVIAGLPLTYQVDGRQVRSDAGPLMPADTEAMVRAIYEVAGRPFERFAELGNHDEDFSFALPGVGRFRANVFRQRGSLGAVVRVIPFGLPDPADFGIPEEVMRIARFQKGLVLVTGPAGAGKSTTMNTVAGLLKPKSGSITFEGHDVTTTPANKVVSLGLALCPEGRRVFQQMSVRENLEMGGYTRPAGEIAASLDQVFEQFPRLKERQRQISGTLSGGEQQMLAMGRALMSKPKLLMLDEPSMGLAPILVEQIFEIILKLNQTGTTILLVEQNAQMALSIANRAYVLETGHIVKEGSADTLMHDDAVRKAYLG